MIKKFITILILSIFVLSIFVLSFVGSAKLDKSDFGITDNDIVFEEKDNGYYFKSDIHKKIKVSIDINKSKKLNSIELGYHIDDKDIKKIINIPITQKNNKYEFELELSVMCISCYVGEYYYSSNEKYTINDLVLPQFFNTTNISQIDFKIDYYRNNIYDYNIGDYKLDLRLDDNYNDSSNKNSNGVSSNVNFINCKYNNCSAFNGNGYIELNANDNFKFNEFTLALWYNPSKSLTVNLYCLITNSNDYINQQNGISFCIDANVGIVRHNSGVITTFGIPYNNSPNFFYISRNSTNITEIYLNNELKYNSANNNQIGNNNIPLNIGNLKHSTGTRYYHFYGSIDNIQIFNKYIPHTDLYNQSAYNLSVGIFNNETKINNTYQSINYNDNIYFNNVSYRQSQNFIHDNINIYNFTHFKFKPYIKIYHNKNNLYIDESIINNVYYNNITINHIINNSYSNLSINVTLSEYQNYLQKNLSIKTNNANAIFNITNNIININENITDNITTYYYYFSDNMANVSQTLYYYDFIIAKNNGIIDYNYNKKLIVKDNLLQYDNYLYYSDKTLYFYNTTLEKKITLRYKIKTIFDNNSSYLVLTDNNNYIFTKSNLTMKAII